MTSTIVTNDPHRCHFCGAPGEWLDDGYGEPVCDTCRKACHDPADADPVDSSDLIDTPLPGAPSGLTTRQVFSLIEDYIEDTCGGESDVIPPTFDALLADIKLAIESAAQFVA